MRKSIKILGLILSVALILPTFVILPVYAAQPKTAVLGVTGDITWSYDPETRILSFDGKGKTESYKSTGDVPWHTYGNFVKKLEIGKDVEEIHPYALYDCSAVEEYVADADSPYFQSGRRALYSRDGKTLFRLTDSAVFAERLKDGVTRIADYAVANSPWIYMLKIPDSVTEVGYAAFKNSKSLQKVTFSQSVTAIPDSCFYNCEWLETIENLNGLNSVGSYAFYQCGRLKETLNLDGVERIGNYAFKDCTALNALEIPDSLKSLGVGSFENTRTSPILVLPPAITEIPQKCFKSTRTYEGTLVLVMSDNVSYIGKNAFESSDVRRILTSVDEVDNDSLWSTLPENLKKIDTKAFYKGCITHLNFNDKLEEIGESAFESSHLKQANISDTIPKIGYNVIADSDYEEETALKENGVIYFGNYAVGMQSKYDEEFVVREGTVGIAESCFGSAYNAEKIYLPASLKYIPDLALPYVNWVLKTIVLDEANPYFCIDNGILYSKDMTRLVKCPPKNKVSELTVPDTVTEVGVYAFGYCSKLKAVTFSPNQTSIPLYCFSGCENLKTITLPKGIKYITKYAFSSCTSLDTVYVLDELCDVDYSYAFNGCTQVKDIYLALSDRNIAEQDEKIQAVYQSWNNLHTKKLKDTAFHYNYVPLVSGDVDGNGSVDVNDATLIQRCAARLIDFDDKQSALADVDGNGEVDINDATAVQRIAAKIV